MPFMFEKLKVPLSISASIAEGNGRFTNADRRNFFWNGGSSLRRVFAWCEHLLEFRNSDGASWCP